MKHFKSIFVLISLLRLLSLPAIASTEKDSIDRWLKFMPNFKAGRSVLIPNSERHDKNLYIAAGSIVIDGHAKKDLLAAGGNILLNGKTEGDLHLAGGDMTLQGSTLGDVRVAGGKIKVTQKIQGDLIAAGGDINITPDSEIQGDVTVFGGNIVLNGKIASNLRAAGGNITIGGHISGDVMVRTPGKLEFLENTTIQGNLYYETLDEIQFSESVSIEGQKNYHALKDDFFQFGNKKPWIEWIKLLSFLWMLKLVSLVLLSVLVLYIFKQGVTEIARHGVDHFWAETLRGFILIVTVPVLSGIAISTIIGIPVGIIALLLYGAFVIAAAIFSIILVAGLIAKNFRRQENFKITWITVLFGYLTIQFAIMIPILGWLTCFALTCASLGTLAYRSYLKILK